ncbi:hypothetical protein ACWELJ_21400 [Nocardia sp. NPDC004582]
MRRSAHRAAAAWVAAPVAVLLSVTGCGSDHSPAKPAKPAPPDLTSAPASVHWVTYQGVSLPVSSKDGPAKIGDAATGFSHTPQGAAMAAINLSTRVTLAPDENWATQAAQSLVSGPAKDAWVLARARVSITRTDPAAVPHISGYKITSWTPEHGVVTVFATYPDNSIAGSDTTVSWIGGDWRLELPDPASQTPTVRSLDAVPADAVRMEAKR